MTSATAPAPHRPPLLTLREHDLLVAARQRGKDEVECSLDLGRSRVVVGVRADGWLFEGTTYPYLERCKERTVYYWNGARFEPVARFDRSLIKLVPTEWGPPTFEIDGVKMLPTQQVSPFDDARRKVALVEPRDKQVLDTCAGLGYFAHWCVVGGAAQVTSFEVNPDVLWLRGLNPWSPPDGPGLRLVTGDVALAIRAMADSSCDAILHDPPRFALAGDLYSQDFYDQLGRVLRPGGRLFHYTGSPNRLSSGRDVPNEVARRLRRAGFAATLEGDGVLAVRGGRSGS